MTNLVGPPSLTLTLIAPLIFCPQITYGTFPTLITLLVKVPTQFLQQLEGLVLQKPNPLAS